MKRAPVPLERGRTELCYGERLRRAKRLGEARKHLRLALESSRHSVRRPVPSAPSRASSEGGAASPVADTQTRRLTPWELQVALAVAREATNKEAAPSLFLSPKTIDFHLGRVCRKLGIRSQVELARIFARDEVGGAAGGVTTPSRTGPEAVALSAKGSAWCPIHHSPSIRVSADLPNELAAASSGSLE